MIYLFIRGAVLDSGGAGQAACAWFVEEALDQVP